MMDDAKNTYKVPTPQDSLESQIMDPNFPKNEREWWAAAEITRLRAEVEALKLERTAAELVHRETATTVLMQMAEVQRLRDAAREVCDWADAAQWALGNEAGVPAAKLDALRKALEGGA